MQKYILSVYKPLYKNLLMSSLQLDHVERPYN